MKGAKRNIMIITVLLFVCAAVYLNWSYNNRWGTADSEMAAAEDAMTEKADDEYTQTMADKDAKTTDYFSKARLSRQTSRDQSVELLKQAAASDSASQETIDGAMNAISAMATNSMKETEVENQLIAKGFSDCVAYIADKAVTVSVPAPAAGAQRGGRGQNNGRGDGGNGASASALNVVEVK